MKPSETMPEAVAAVLARGAVIPAHPLALTEARALDEVHQRALTRYYLDAGAGGLAVGVHTTQFQIREAGLLEPVLRLAMETAAAWTERPCVMIAGLVGRTEQALAEAEIARALGYHAGLLSLAAYAGAAEDEIVAHCAAVARHLPLIGFYLQPAVGGRVLSFEFWRRFAQIENVAGFKFIKHALTDGASCNQNIFLGVAVNTSIDQISLYILIAALASFKVVECALSGVAHSN